MLDIKSIINNSESVVREVIPGVYFLIKMDKIIYVGQSEDCHRRFTMHRRKKYGKTFHRYYIIPISDIEERLELEEYYIKTIKPKHNKAHTE